MEDVKKYIVGSNIPRESFSYFKDFEKNWSIASPIIKHLELPHQWYYFMTRSNTKFHYTAPRSSISIFPENDSVIVHDNKGRSCFSSKITDLNLKELKQLSRALNTHLE